jgi:hypothetical protein
MVLGENDELLARSILGGISVPPFSEPGKLAGIHKTLFQRLHQLV